MTNETAQPTNVGSNDQLERAAFEAWFSEGGKGPAAVRRSGDFYMLAAAQAAWTAYKAAWDCQQAEIDRLMLEHCPDEMSPRQLAEWAKHQVAAPDFDEAALDAALKA